MMKINEPPGGARRRQGGLQPGALDGIAGPPIRVIGVAVEAKDFDGPVSIFVIAFVSGKAELSQTGGVSSGCRRGKTTVMVPHRRKKAIGNGARTVCTCIRENVIVIILSNVLIDGAGLTIRIIVVAKGHDEIGIPTLDQIGHSQFVRCAGAVIANDSNDPHANIGCEKQYGTKKV